MSVMLFFLKHPPDIIGEVYYYTEDAESSVNKIEEAPNKFVYANNLPIDKIDRDNMYNTIGLNALR